MEDAKKALEAIEEAFSGDLWQPLGTRVDVVREQVAIIRKAILHEEKLKQALCSSVQTLLK